jgi:hypothetical protein
VLWPLKVASGLVIVWRNGTHGSGKTTLVQPLLLDSRVFDAERGRRDGSWTSRPGCRGRTPSNIGRRGGQLVVETARGVLDCTGGTLVMPMTVLVERYWGEISTGLAHHPIPVRHVVDRRPRNPPGAHRGGTRHPLPRSASNASKPYAEAARTGELGAKA